MLNWNCIGTRTWFIGRWNGWSQNGCHISIWTRAANDRWTWLHLFPKCFHRFWMRWLKEGKYFCLQYEILFEEGILTGIIIVGMWFFSIIGAYIAVVLLLGKLIRGVVTGGLYDIQYAEVPNVDRIMQLCLDIFLVREEKDYVLEIELFAKLLFLFRSPATMIDWTKPKVD